jgi:hypothetical protein
MHTYYSNKKDAIANIFNMNEAQSPVADQMSSRHLAK